MFCETNQRYFCPDDPLHPFRGSEIISTYQGQQCNCDIGRKDSCVIHYPNGDPNETKLWLQMKMQKKEELELKAKEEREESNKRYFKYLDETSKLDARRLVRIKHRRA